MRARYGPSLIGTKSPCSRTHSLRKVSGSRRYSGRLPVNRCPRGPRTGEDVVISEPLVCEGTGGLGASVAFEDGALPVHAVTGHHQQHLVAPADLAARDQPLEVDDVVAADHVR